MWHVTREMWWEVNILQKFWRIENYFNRYLRTRLSQHIFIKYTRKQRCISSGGDDVVVPGKKYWDPMISCEKVGNYYHQPLFLAYPAPFHVLCSWQAQYLKRNKEFHVKRLIYLEKVTGIPTACGHQTCLGWISAPWQIYPSLFGPGTWWLWAGFQQVGLTM